MLKNSETVPDRLWYAAVSREARKVAHCPYATVEGCPRYYQSLSLLSNVGATPIDPNEDQRLLKFWTADATWPRTLELATSFSGESTFTNFCPEVSLGHFGYAATYLTDYADEIDRDSAHFRLQGLGVEQNDPRWVWGALLKQHYLECPLYAVLSHRLAKVPPVESWIRSHSSEILVGLLTTAGAVVAAYIARL